MLSINSQALVDQMSNIPITQKETHKLERIKSISQCKERIFLLRLEITVTFLERYADMIFQKLENSKKKHFYIKPVNKIATHFHLLFSKRTKENKIYIFSKHKILGQGYEKKVTSGFDYFMEKEIAVGSIRTTLEKTIQKIKKEFSIQQGFGEALDLYKYPSKDKCKLVMPLANWGSLEKATTPLGHEELKWSLTSEQLEQAFFKILEKVASIHAKKQVIADIKPANLLLHVEEGEVLIRITDFGFAYQDTSTGPYKLQGTIEFIAPEYYNFWMTSMPFRGPTMPRDVFALGRSLWEIFLGGPPPWMIGVSPEKELLDPKEYEKAWLNVSFAKGSVEALIHQMTAPTPQERPTMDSIIKKPFLFKFSSPFYKDWRLLTEKESIERFRLVKIDYEEEDDGLNPKFCFTLEQGKSEYFFLRSHSEKVMIIPTFEEKLFIEGTFYSTLEDYLKLKNLIHCLNFYA